MKMDMNGIFHLKNLGKTLIYVSGTKVGPGESVNLTSGCLIEVLDCFFNRENFSLLFFFLQINAILNIFR